MKKKIFISHSCKDEELSQAGCRGRAPETISSERLQRLRFAQIVRDTVHEALKDAFEALLDRVCLKGGDNWPIKLNTWLARCDAAVIFLTPEALEKSDWVLKETTVLCWRNMLGAQVAVFPVWLFVERKHFEDGHFGPTEIDRVQHVVKHHGALTADEARRIGLEVADRIKESLEAKTGSKTAKKGAFEKWVEDLATFLASGLGSSQKKLCTACEILGIEPVGAAGENDERQSLASALAYALMLCDSIKREEAVEELARPLNNKKDVLDQIAPTWVPARAAAFMLEAPRPNGILIRIRPHEGFGSGRGGYGAVELVKDFVRRAFCCKPGMDQGVIDLTVTGEIGPESGRWLLEQIEERLCATFIDIDFDSAVKKRSLPVFGVLNRWPRLEALQQAASRFPTLLCVFVGRDDDCPYPSVDWVVEAFPHFSEDDTAHRQMIKRLLRPLS